MIKRGLAPLFLYKDILTLSNAFSDAVIECFSKAASKPINILSEDPKIFVCGGPITGSSSATPQSFREHFLVFFEDNSPDEITEDNILLAETFKDYFKNNNYQDLMTFEKDIADISDIIMIFLESPGSLVELGIFCTLPDSYPKIIIIVPEEHVIREDSFIFLGPLENIKKANRDSVLVYPWPVPNQKFDKIHLEQISEKVMTRVEKIPSRTKFKENNNGHITFLIAEIIRLSFPITRYEIEIALLSLEIDIDENRLDKAIYLGKKLNIFKLKNYDSKDYFYPSHDKKQYVKISRLDKTGSVMAIKQSFVLKDDLESRTRAHVLSEIQNSLINGATK